MPEELRGLLRETIDQFNENRNPSPVFLSNRSSYTFFLKDRHKKPQRSLPSVSRSSPKFQSHGEKYLLWLGVSALVSIRQGQGIVRTQLPPPVTQGDLIESQSRFLEEVMFKMTSWRWAGVNYVGLGIMNRPAWLGDPCNITQAGKKLVCLMKGVVSKVAWAKREKGGEYKVRLERDESQDTSHNWKNERAYDPLMVEYSKRRESRREI